MYSAHPKDWEAGGTEAGEEEGSYPAMYTLYSIYVL